MFAYLISEFWGNALVKHSVHCGLHKNLPKWCFELHH